MIRTKLRKQHNKDISLKKSSLVSRKIAHPITDFCIPQNPPQIFESSGSQSSHNNNNNNNNNKKNHMKSSRGKDEYVPLTLNPELRKRRTNSTNTRKKIFPIKSDSSVEAPNIVIRQHYQQNRPVTAATSHRKKHMNRNEFLIKDHDLNEKDIIESDENDADNCFQIIKDAIEDVIETSLKKILSTQIPVINQKLEEVYNYMQKNEDDLANCFKELEARITHYGEDQGRHIRYLCMKLEFDKLLHSHIDNLMVTSSGHSRCCHSNPISKSYTSGISYRQQYPLQQSQQLQQPQQQQQQQQQNQQQQQQQHQQQQQQQHSHQQQPPQNTCACCFDNSRRILVDQTIPTQDSVRCSSARPSTLNSCLHNIKNYDSKPIITSSESPKKGNILHQCGDGQQNDLNNKSVLSILEELKKHNSSDLRTSSILKTNITQNNSEDFNSIYNTQNLSSDNTADIGLKDILATIQKYYPIVDKNVFDNIRNANNNRIDMELEMDKDIDTHRSYDE